MNRFQTTRWSLVLDARQGDARSRRALETLCRTYRAPVLAYIRRRGVNSAESEDLAQSFFTRFIEHAFHVQADPTRGRFRAFLLTALKGFLNDAGDRAHAIKRGGQIEFRSLDSLTSGTMSVEGIHESATPEREFERDWAQAVLQSAMRQLRKEAKLAGKAALFDALCEFLVERPDETDYARVAEAMNLRRNTLAVAVHRMRHRLRELVCAELAETAAEGGDLEQELDELRHCLGKVLQ